MSTKTLRIVAIGQQPDPAEPELTLVLAPTARPVAEGARLETPPEGRVADAAWLQSVLSRATRSLADVWTGQQAAAAPRSVGQLRDEIRRFVQWHGLDHADTCAAIEACKAHPDCREGTVEEAVRQGLADRRRLEELSSSASKLGPDHPQVRERAHQITTQQRYLAKAVEKILSYERGRRSRRVETQKTVGRSGDATTVKPSAQSHRIQALAPAKHWRLFIDESGSNFDVTKSAPGSSGRLVGVLVPDTVQLPLPAKPFHAVEATNAETDQMIQRLLDAPVGILGLEVAGLPPTAGDRWISGVLELVQWTARLLPKGGPTTLDVLIEQRGSQDATHSWTALAAQVQRELVDVDRGRYQDFTLSLQVVPKDQDKRLGYADAVSFTWGSSAQASRARLRASGLLGGSLIQGAATELRQAWDRLARPASISGPAWREAISLPGAEDETTLAGTLLRRLGEAVQADVVLWRRFAEVALSHLDSKAVHLPAAGREGAWLERWRPALALLPGKLRLAWLTGRLEAANHLGHTDSLLLQELDTLSGQLFDEVPELVCQADLNRAVLSTNRFDFDGATAALSRWRELPPAVPGLQHWARVQSSLGQHEAFRGRWPEAQAFFQSALEAFGRLSDPELATREASQTRTYQVIAAMDDPDAPIDTVRALVAGVTALDPDSIGRLATSPQPADKYRHHLLLRYLAAWGSPEERAAYLSTAAGWQSGDGHPWPLIHAWRAALLAGSDPDTALQQARAGLDRAQADGQGPLVRFIGAAIATAATGIGLAPPEDAALDDLARTLPLAADRIAFLRDARDGRLPFVEVMETALPFNFR
jgi:hypothetical protein